MKKSYRKYIKKLEKKVKVFKSWNLPILTILAFIILFAGISIFSLIVKAEITNLYPGSCLGGWINTQNAQGGPNLDSDASADLFNESNSSVLKNAIAQIFCGSFNGVIPQDNEPKKVFLKFSWNITEESAVSVASSTVTIISESFASSTSDIIGEPKDQVVSPTNLETGFPSQTVLPEESATSSPSSFWRTFAGLALAQETNLETGFPSEVASSTPDVLDSGEFLEISYTLDSVNWTTLGRINRSNWRSAQFELPITNWADIQKVQISIQAIPTIDERPTVYLDGMWIEAEYEISQTFQSKTASILSQSSNPNVSPNVSYSRTPSDSNIMGSVIFNISADSFEDFGFDNGCGLGGQPCNFWGVRAENLKGENSVINSACVSSETLSHVFNMVLPEAYYTEVMVFAGNTQESCEAGGELSKFLEGDSSHVIFSVTSQN